MRQKAPIIEILSPSHRTNILRLYHTVQSLQEESGRSRAWAYRIMSSLPIVEAIDLTTGKRLRLVRRDLVRRHMRTLRSPGNPNWR